MSSSRRFFSLLTAAALALAAWGCAPAGSGKLLSGNEQMVFVNSGICIADLSSAEEISGLWVTKVGGGIESNFVRHGDALLIECAWEGGEKRRVRRLERQGLEALDAYRETRGAIALGRLPEDVSSEILGLATSSIAESWWWHSGRDGGWWWHLVEEAARLAVLKVDGELDMNVPANLAATRLGLGKDARVMLARRVERGVARGVEDLQPASMEDAA